MECRRRASEGHEASVYDIREKRGTPHIGSRRDGQVLGEEAVYVVIREVDRHTAPKCKDAGLQKFLEEYLEKN